MAAMTAEGSSLLLLLLLPSLLAADITIDINISGEGEGRVVSREEGEVVGRNLTSRVVSRGEGEEVGQVGEGCRDKQVTGHCSLVEEILHLRILLN